MIVIRIIVLKFRMSIPGHRSDRCDGSNHLARHNVSWPFTVKSTISFASVDIYYVQPTIGC